MLTTVASQVLALAAAVLTADAHLESALASVCDSHIRYLVMAIREYMLK